MGTKTLFAILFTLVVLAVAGFIAFRAFVYEPFRMHAGSMEPTLRAGSLVVAAKWGYGNYGTYGRKIARGEMTAPVKRGDVLVFEYPVNPSTVFLKRVIGLPGDTVAYKSKRLSINGKETMREAAGEHLVTFDHTSRAHKKYKEQLDDTVYFTLADDERPAVFVPGVRAFPMREKCTYDANGFVCQVPQGHYFMMGDYRDNSDDSRYWGFVPKENIVGKIKLDGGP